MAENLFDLTDSVFPDHSETAMTDANEGNERFANAILPRIPARRRVDS